MIIDFCSGGESGQQHQLFFLLILRGKMIMRIFLNFFFDFSYYSDKNAEKMLGC